MQTQLSTTSPTPSCSISETECERISQWFASKCLRAYPTLRPCHEDLLQSFRLATWLATKKFDPKRGRFLSFVIPRLKSELSKFRRDVWKQDQNLRNDFRPEEGCVYIDFEHDELSDLALHGEILRNQHPDFSVWYNHTISGFSLAEISRLMGLSRQRVHQIYKRALETIRDNDA